MKTGSVQYQFKAANPRNPQFTASRFAKEVNVTKPYSGFIGFIKAAIKGYFNGCDKMYFFPTEQNPHS